jgi:hypothetical protein
MLDSMSQLLAGKIFKGLYAAGMSFFGSMATVLQDNTTLHTMTAGQWFTIGAFTLGAFGGTFGLATWTGPKVGSGTG